MEWQLRVLYDAVMAVSEPWKRYVEAGMELTEVTRTRAEKLVKDLVKAGEVQRHEAAQWAEDLVERSRKTTESVAETVRVEVQKQLENLGLVPRATKPGPEPAPKKAAPTAKKASAKQAAPTATNASTKKPATKKAPGGS